MSEVHAAEFHPPCEKITAAESNGICAKIDTHHRFSPMLPQVMRAIAGSATGIPSEEEFLAEYCRLTGRDGIPNWNFYLAFSFFRLASILQGVYKRGIMGNASSTEAMERGRLAREIADLAGSLLK